MIQLINTYRRMMNPLELVDEKTGVVVLISTVWLSFTYEIDLGVSLIIVFGIAIVIVVILRLLLGKLLDMIPKKRINRFLWGPDVDSKEGTPNIGEVRCTQCQQRLNIPIRFTGMAGCPACKKKIHLEDGVITN